MKRIVTPRRSNWIKRVEDIGFSFHTLPDGTADPMYWDEGHAYEFSLKEIDVIEDASQVLYRMCLSAVDYVIKKGLMGKLGIPEGFRASVHQSWVDQDIDLYGRFDFAFDQSGVPKMLEFNADTPTSLFESSVVQWYWLEDTNAATGSEFDQFNSIHEKLEGTLRDISRTYIHGVDSMYFSCMKNTDEDRVTVDYIRDVATQAGLRTKFINIEDIGWNGRTFTDLDEHPIRTIFKLYPWEFLVRDEFGKHLLNKCWDIIEPTWKMILSNKGLLPILWEMYPNHPNLLPAYWEPGKLGNTYVKKPLLSREGADITIVRDGIETISDHTANYGQFGYVYQEYLPLVSFDGAYPILGSWIIGGRACGLGIREDKNLITGNNSHFVPHYFVE